MSRLRARVRACVPRAACGVCAHAPRTHLPFSFIQSPREHESQRVHERVCPGSRAEGGPGCVFFCLFYLVWSLVSCVVWSGKIRVLFIPLLPRSPCLYIPMCVYVLCVTCTAILVLYLFVHIYNTCSTMCIHKELLGIHVCAPWCARIYIMERHAYIYMCVYEHVTSFVHSTSYLY